MASDLILKDGQQDLAGPEEGKEAVPKVLYSEEEVAPDGTPVDRLQSVNDVLDDEFDPKAVVTGEPPALHEKTFRSWSQARPAETPGCLPQDTPASKARSEGRSSRAIRFVPVTKLGEISNG